MAWQLMGRHQIEAADSPVLRAFHLKPNMFHHATEFVPDVDPVCLWEGLLMDYIIDEVILKEVQK